MKHRNKLKKILFGDIRKTIVVIGAIIVSWRLLIPVTSCSSRFSGGLRIPSFGGCSPNWEETFAHVGVVIVLVVAAFYITKKKNSK